MSVVRCKEDHSLLGSAACRREGKYVEEGHFMSVGKALRPWKVLNVGNSLHVSAFAVEREREKEKRDHWAEGM